MPPTNATLQESIAAELAHDAFYIGTDGDGCRHFWSMYHQQLQVVESDATVTTVKLADTPLEGLSDWLAYVADKRGDWRETRVER